MAETFRARREELGLSIRALSDRAGVSYGTIRRLEAGELTVQIDPLLQAINVLGIDPRVLIGGEADQPMRLERLGEVPIERLDRTGPIPEILRYVAAEWEARRGKTRRKQQ